MERPSKRRRLLQRAALRQAHDRSADAPEPESNIALSNQDKRHGREAPLPHAGPHGALNDLKQPDSLKGMMQKVHLRELAPSSVSQVAHPMTTAVESVVRVIIDNPSGTAVGDVLVPAQSSVFTFDGYGSVTLPSNTGLPTSSPQPPARFESPSTYTTPGPQSQAPQPTPQPAPMVTDQSSSRPSGASTTNVPTSTNSQASQSPMTINVPGSSSQVVLSPPPATPIPSSSSSSIPSTSASSTDSTTSYFSLPLSISSGTTSSQTSASPIPIQPPTSLNAPAPTSGNFSMTCKSLFN